MISKNCPVCKENFYKKTSTSKKSWALQKFCSKKCGYIGGNYKANKTSFKNGHKSRLNKPHSVKSKEKMSISHKNI